MHGDWEERAVQASGFITAGARARHLGVVGLHDALRDRGARVVLTDFAADWFFHPSDRGHRVWADAFWTELKRSSPLTTELDPASGGQRPQVGLKPHP